MESKLKTSGTTPNTNMLNTKLWLNSRCCIVTLVCCVFYPLPLCLSCWVTVFHHFAALWCFLIPAVKCSDYVFMPVCWAFERLHAILNKRPIAWVTKRLQWHWYEWADSCWCIRMHHWYEWGLLDNISTQFTEGQLPVRKAQVFTWALFYSSVPVCH